MFAVLQDYTTGVAFDDCVPQFCRGLSTDANSLGLSYTTQLLPTLQRISIVYINLVAYLLLNKSLRLALATYPMNSAGPRR
jgi:hypothetical protein